MTGEQFAELLGASDSQPEKDGWTPLGDRTLTLHTSCNGAAMSFARVEKVKQSGELVLAHSARGETFVFRLGDLFAATLESTREKTRKAGFQ